MGTFEDVPRSAQFPLIFEITDGPTFQRIADAAKYYHDADVRMPLRFSGTLTEWMTGRSRRVKLTAKAWGFYAGSNYKRGDMVVFIDLPGYSIRFGGEIAYNWRDRKGGHPLELSRLSQKR